MSEQNLMETPSHDGGDFDGGDFGNDDFTDEPGSSNQGGQPAPGMGQSKSSRRRRRKRKNKLAAEGAGSGSGAEGESVSPSAPIVMEGESLALASSPAQPQQQQQQPRKPQGGFQNNQGGQGQQSGKRWKKKFRDRDRDRRPQRNENPGNDFRGDNGGSNGYSQQNSYGRDYRPDNFGNLIGGFKRKGKNSGQPKERGFVGPMDHSYRESEDGAAAPPSTINVQGGHGRRGNHRHHGDNQPIDYNMPRPVPIPEDAQTHIYFFIEDLFFVAKIQETAKKLGVKVAFLKNDKDAVAELTSAEENKPALIVFDLNNANAKPLTLIPKLKTKLKKSASIVGFLSHLQGDLKAKGVEAGCDVVMPRSAFSQNLPNLLRRYGSEEGDDVNYNY